MKAPTQIQSTTDYSKFKSNPKQRTFTARKVNEKKASMAEDGWWPNEPMSVYKSHNGFVINAGHHRLAAARELGIPVLFIVENQWDTSRITREGRTNSKWSLKDLVVTFASDGNTHYQRLLAAHAKGIPLILAASMMHGHAAESSNVNPLVSNGEFKVKSLKEVAEWVKLVDEFGSRIPALKHRAFIQAFSKCLLTPCFDPETFTHKLRSNPTMLEKTSNADQSLGMIDAIYNFRSRSPIPLLFMVTENAKERGANKS